MSKHRDVPLVGRGWRALCSAVPLFLILATMIVVPPVAIAQEAPSTGATGASGPTGTTSPVGPPTIASDKADYAPGEQVTLTGTDWADGEVVHIVVNDTIGQTWQHVVDVTAASDGSIVDVFNLPKVFISDYDVTATGPISGTATTTFTDNVPTDFTQCAQNETNGTVTGLGNCHWINSILQGGNSMYFEGMMVPQRLLFKEIPATASNIHTLTFHINFTKGGVHAYDFLGSWAQAGPTAPQATSLAIPSPGFATTLNPCGQEIPTSGTVPHFDTVCNAIQNTNVFNVDVPDDNFISANGGAVQSRINAFEAVYGNRQIQISGNSAISAAVLSPPAHSVGNLGDTGDSDINYTLTWTSASDQIMVKFAGHLAVSVDGTGVSWGSQSGAGSINGGPYHVSMDLLDGASIGNQDNQITSDDIIAPGRKEGRKCNDLNADHVCSVNEPGLNGWTIQAFKDTDGNGVLSLAEYQAGVAASNVTHTDPSDNTKLGIYGIPLPAVGTPKGFNGKYIVCEVISGQTGWSQTLPQNTICSAGSATLAGGGYAITVQEGQLHSGNDFGNAQSGTKAGVKFNDLNGDGVKDAGEPNIVGWKIYAIPDPNGDGDITATDFTNKQTAITTGTGYSFSLAPGKWLICEEAQPTDGGATPTSGWTQSYPKTGVTDVSDKCSTDTDVTGMAAKGYYITMTSGDTTTHLNNHFGNFHSATKSGRKFEDLNADGDDEGGTDPGKGGTTINAYADLTGNGVLDQADFNAGVKATANTTAGTGAYSLSLAPGKYIVCEATQAGWTQSAPSGTVCDLAASGLEKGGYAIDLDSNETDSGNDFGNFRSATKSGRKFEDLNADGDDEGGTDPGKGDTTINAYADLTGNGVLDQADFNAGVKATANTTAGTGAYSLSLAPGKYIVCEATQAGWTQSAPSGTVCDLAASGLEKGGYAIDLDSNETDSGNDFGNFRSATKSGRKFEDLNADGDDEGGTDPGKGDTTINAYADLTGNGVLDQADFNAGVKATANTTAGTGAYSLSLAPGKYIVCEATQAGWTQSAPSGTVCDLAASGLEKGGYAIDLDSNETDSGNDFGNFRSATKSGRKFEDLNADGDDEGGTDPGKGDTTINAYADLTGNGVLDQADFNAGVKATANTTAGTGAYSLSLAPGKYIVCEATQAGWTQSAPSGTVCDLAASGLEKGGYAIDLDSNETDSGNDFGNFRSATKSGRKFEDLNADGDDEGGTDPGKGDTTINAYADLTGNGVLDQADFNAGVKATANTTAGTGAYSLSLAPGKYIVCEATQAGWTQSAPSGTVCDLAASGLEKGGYAIDLDSNETDSGNDFGNFRSATKSGRKFEDLNADGDDEGGTDPGKGDTTINAYADLTGNGVLDQADFNAGVKATANTTAGTGAYSLSLAPGKYIVCEATQAGWTQSAPSGTVCDLAASGLEKGGYAIDLDSNETDSGNDFGNFRSATKSGRKFEDLNADGDDEGGTDPGKGDTTINAYADLTGNGVLDQADFNAGVKATANTTAGTGAYSLSLAPGKYIVCEATQAGWTQSAPSGTVCDLAASGLEKGGYAIDLDSNETDSGNDFGNFRSATKSGRKFEDLNADGDDEGGTDPGKGDTTINAYADLTGNGVLDQADFNAGVKATANTTAGTGAYSLSLAPGKYIVCEATQAGWTQSAPSGTVCDLAASGLEKGGYAIDLDSNETDSGNDFGNFRSATKSGRKFEDLNADGDDEGGTDPGKGDTTINAYADLTGNGVLDQADFNAGVKATANTTAGTGAYSLSLAPGKYIVCEATQAGWTQSAPSGTVCDLAASGLEKGGYAIDLDSNETDSGNDFGNFRSATKSGRKFEDLNADGDDEGGTDPGKGDTTINAYADLTGNGVLDQADFNAGVKATANTTAGTGAYSLSLAPGKYIVCEATQAGWTQSAPSGTVCDLAASGLEKGGYAIDLDSNETDSGNDFGNFRSATKSGRKFEDLNADGDDEGGTDPGKGDTTINAYADLTGNGVLDQADFNAGVKATANTTAGTGAYSLSLAPGKYIVCEATQAGWTQSAPSGTVCDLAASGLEKGGYAIDLDSNETDSGNDFGNFRSATKSGRKFEDLNADGDDEGGTDPGKGDTTINAYADLTGNGVLDQADFNAGVKATANTTAGTGAYSLSLAPGKYIVCEATQAGWTQSAPSGTVCDLAASGLEKGGYAIDLDSNETDSGNDFGNFRSATKSGRKFEDLNADGDDEGGTDPGKGDTTINAYADLTGNGVLDQADFNAGVKATANTTAGTGAYSLSLAPGKYIVCEATQAGWTQSAPSGTVCDLAASGLEKGGYAIDLDSNETDSGNDFGNFRSATKSGRKFEDLNADGDDEGGTDPGKGDTTINAYADLTGNGVLDQADFNAGVKATANTTAGTGAYSLSLAPGKYIVCEATQAGWTQSAPSGTVCDLAASGLEKGGYAIDLDSNETDSGNDFGNFRSATKSGRKFEDLNADGDDEGGTDPGKGDTTINAYADLTGNGVLDQADFNAGVKATANTTAGTGAYSLSLAPGKYIVCEATQAGWTQSAPSGTVCDLAASGLEKGGYAIDLDSNETDSGNDFGNFRSATKSGRKFEDLNADGDDEGGTDPGKGDTTINAYADLTGNGVLDQADFNAGVKATANTTAGTGAYSLSLAPGKYIVCEATQAGWTQSAPSGTVCDLAASGLEKGGYAIDLDSNETDSGNDFGNFRSATKSGRKFEDLNADGDDEGGTDPGKGDTTINAYADLTGNGVLDQADFNAGVKATANTTAGTGAYSLSLAPGKYIVCEATQAGWTQSAPSGTVCDLAASGLEKGGYAIDLDSNETDSGNDFGNFRSATKSGRKFEDLNADGDDEGGTDPGKGDTTINAYADLTGNGVLDQADFNAGVKATANTTAGTGAYSLSLAPGKYIVCEATQAGWTQSAPSGTVCDLAASGLEKGGYAIDLDSNETDSGNDFGNFRKGTKSGIKFESKDHQGAFDAANDTPKSGWVIYLYADDGDGVVETAEKTPIDKTTTGAGGAYSFTLNPGSYIVCEAHVAGWTQSYPSSGSGDCALAVDDGGTPSTANVEDEGYAFTITSGDTTTHVNNDFGNFKPSQAQITPTQTTCQQFTGHTADTLSQLNYSVRSGKISQVDPGVFFYWVQVTAPSTALNTFVIDQTITTGNFNTYFNIANGSFAYTSGCVKIQSATVTQSPADQTRVTFNTVAGTTYIIGIKYDTGSVKNATAPDPTTVHYDFETLGQGSTTQGIDLKKKV